MSSLTAVSSVMQTFYFSVNPNSAQLIAGNVVQFWFLTMIALVVGVVVYRLLVSSKTRRAIPPQRRRTFRWLLPVTLLAPTLAYVLVAPHVREEAMLYGLLVLSAIAGAVVFILLSTGHTLAQQRAILLASGLAGLIVLVAYQSNWTGFYQLDIQGTADEVSLRYFYPARTVALKRSEIQAVEGVPAYEGLWYLMIRTSSGHRYRSNKMYRWDFENQLPQLRERLHVG